jgi:hypothetical protein
MPSDFRAGDASGLGLSAAFGNAGPQPQEDVGISTGEPADVTMEQMDRDIARGLKREREEAEGEAEEEEFEARVMQRVVAPVSPNGPPWLDANGMQLDEEKVKIGMDKERASLKSFPTYIEVDESEPAKYGKKLIRSGWVLSDRGETVKARLVAQEVNKGDWMDVFAATPMSASLRILLQRAIKLGWTVQLADLSTAFLYAKLDEGELVYVLPPQSERVKGKVWRLLRSLYGLRRSPQRFQEHFAQVLKEAGFRRLISDPQMYIHETMDAMIVAHVDRSDDRGARGCAREGARAAGQGLQGQVGRLPWPGLGQVPR